MSRATQAITLAVGLLALGCSREAEPRGEEQARTAGMEEPIVADPGGQPGMRGPSQTTPQVAEVAPVSEAELASFADVIIRLAELEQEAAARVDAGQPAEQVTAELQPRVDRVFEGTMLTADRFKEIADRAEEDPELRQRIEAHLQQRVQAPA